MNMYNTLFGQMLESVERVRFDALVESPVLTGTVPGTLVDAACGDAVSPDNGRERAPRHRESVP